MAFDVPAGRADEALAAMRLLGIAGLSGDDAAQGAGRRRGRRPGPGGGCAALGQHGGREDDGRLVGHSTDGAGFVAALHAEGVDVCGMHVAVLGAGAAARSVVAALDRAGAADIAVVNRTPARSPTSSPWRRTPGQAGRR